MRKTLLGACLVLGFTSLVLAAPAHRKKPVARKAPARAVLTGLITVTAPPRPRIVPQRVTMYGYGARPTPTPAPPQPEEIIVYFERVEGRWPPPKEPAVLDQQKLKFTHRILPVLKGTVVSFTNQDPVYHNIFSNSQANPKFDLGKKSKGQSASVTLTSLEVPVKVFCEIHSTMTSNILVLQNPFFTRVAPGEAYRIEGVPPGTYQVTAWHDYWEPVKATVTLRAGETRRWDAVLTQARP